MQKDLKQNKKLPKLAQQFLLNFCGYKHDRHQLRLKYKNFSVQYPRAELYANQYWVSDFKNLINLISLNLIPPQFIQNFSRYEHFKNVTT